MDNQFSRPAIFTALGLSIAMVLGVVLGAKYVLTHADRAPVTITALPSDGAGSPRCSALINSLPDKFMGHPRAEVAQPQPPGTAAWATFSDTPVTLRCGVDLPYQYNVFSQTQTIGGNSWLEVKDMTPGSDLVTWYNTDHVPTVAVTTHDNGEPKLDLSALDPADEKISPRPAPLADLAAGNTDSCEQFMNALPAEITPDYHSAQPGVATVKHSRAWVAKGREAIVLRCGVAPPPGYQAGKRLVQVNDIPWFEDTTLAGGTTASTWFALGRATDIAVYVPQDVAGEVLVVLGDLITETTPVQ
ncbi:hypothetical protein CPHO_06635 [Corynebacterium phocae]|uniref:DUF3515 domain-containing protein n=1 Tax=Corynebacterium phocae TaxID=161895 RepID=A0A1L7D3H0_9CORY|nr:DUF3515 domain-containing protein [Corynebacterium phocae]APT92623.1 hypothetical protein CPHO_06635 [Corynebacterium phocae]KAA8724180.1 DUF3515 domain-containing protein [Corynebacterium phocae]